MKTRGMSFAASLVEAVMSGAKTQTRRMGERPPAAEGDVMYVREACFIGPAGSWNGACTVNPEDPGQACYFKAGSSAGPPEGVRWRRSLFMPRWAARTLLEVTAVRRERLQDISEEDAAAEGVTACTGESPVEAFRTLWDSIYSRKGLGWESNPEVWRIVFRVKLPCR